MQQEITISVIMRMLLRHIRLIIVFVLVGAIIGFVQAYFFTTPTFSSTGVLLIQSSDANYVAISTAQGTTGNRVVTSDMTASEKLAKTCSVLFKINSDMKKELAGSSLTIQDIEETSFLRFTVVSNNREKVQQTTQNLLEKAVTVYDQNFKAGRASIQEDASYASYASTSNIKRNTIIFTLAGLALAVLVSFFLEIIDSSVKPDDDLYKRYGIPVFAEILEFDSSTGGKK